MRRFAAAAVLLLVAAGCGSSGSHGGSALPRPASDYSATVDNKWFPLPVGATWVYRGVKDGKRARDVVTVASEVQKIHGVPAAVVHDRLYLDAKMVQVFLKDPNGITVELGFFPEREGLFRRSQEEQQAKARTRDAKLRSTEKA